MLKSMSDLRPTFCGEKAPQYEQHDEQNTLTLDAFATGGWSRVFSHKQGGCPLRADYLKRRSESNANAVASV